MVQAFLAHSWSLAMIVKYQTIDVYHRDFVPGWQQTALSDYPDEGGKRLRKEHLSNNNHFRHSLRMALTMKCDKELSYICNIQELFSKHKWQISHVISDGEFGGASCLGWNFWYTDIEAIDAINPRFVRGVTSLQSPPSQLRNRRVVFHLLSNKLL